MAGNKPKKIILLSVRDTIVGVEPSVTPTGSCNVVYNEELISALIVLQQADKDIQIILLPNWEAKTNLAQDEIEGINLVAIKNLLVRYGLTVSAVCLNASPSYEQRSGNQESLFGSYYANNVATMITSLSSEVSSYNRPNNTSRSDAVNNRVLISRFQGFIAEDTSLLQAVPGHVNKRHVLDYVLNHFGDEAYFYLLDSSKDVITAADDINNAKNVLRIKRLKVDMTDHRQTLVMHVNDLNNWLKSVDGNDAAEIRASADKIEAVANINEQRKAKRFANFQSDISSQLERLSDRKAKAQTIEAICNSLVIIQTIARELESFDFPVNSRNQRIKADLAAKLGEFEKYYNKEKVCYNQLNDINSYLLTCKQWKLHRFGGDSITATAEGDPNSKKELKVPENVRLQLNEIHSARKGLSTSWADSFAKVKDIGYEQYQKQSNTAWYKRFNFFDTRYDDTKTYYQSFKNESTLNHFVQEVQTELTNRRQAPKG